MTSCHTSPSTSSAASAGLTIALVGNPNCGKTTLFNVLTGAKQHIGNWPGVTVERKSGSFSHAQTAITVIDLPGVYALSLPNDGSAVDERIACDFILAREADVIVNIVDASSLERNLYLTTQLLEMGAPVILALNMMDIAQGRQIYVDTEKLAQALGCPVVALSANKGHGLAALKELLVTCDKNKKRAPTFPPFPELLQQAIAALDCTPLLAIRLLENDQYLQTMTTPELLQSAAHWQARIQHELGEDADILIADARYRFVNQLITQCVKEAQVKRKGWTARIDTIVLNRVLGIPIFLCIMYLLFFFSINIGGAFQDFFDIGSQTILVDGLAHVLVLLHAPLWLVAILANGVGKGINTVITFIPVIGAMFLFLAVLEDSGYMARAAFVVDRFMRILGLPGKAFVPMIVGFGCNVPAIMGARTLENKSDRILTIMMTPFMSCGARLAIFAVFTTAFFPHGGQNIIFALYLIGIFMAVATGFLLRKTILQGDPSPLIMELPSYHVPQVKTLLLHAWQRLKGFVVRAGRLIVPICILIGVFNSLNINGTLNGGEGDSQSILSLVGQWVTPLFSPMGLHPENWPATVGLVTGVLAKEVVVGTLNTLYSQVGHFAAQADTFQFWAGLKAAWQSIGDNFSELGSAFSNPVLAKAPVHALGQGVYGLMYEKFDGQVGAFAYLLFILLYFPCVSTVAVMLRELNRGWAVFSMLWMTCVAYGAAVVFYQAATWTRHPLSSSLWVTGMTGLFLGMIFFMRFAANRNDKMKKMEKITWAY